MEKKVRLEGISGGYLTQLLLEAGLPLKLGQAAPGLAQSCKSLG